MSHSDSWVYRIGGSWDNFHTCKSHLEYSLFLRETRRKWMMMEDPFSGQAEKLCTQVAEYIIIRHRGAGLKGEIQKNS